MMMRFLVVLLLACGKHDDPPPPAPAPAAPVAPDAAGPAKCATYTGMPVDHYTTVSTHVPGAASAETGPLVIDTAPCAYVRATSGTTWAIVHPLDDKRCEVWVGHGADLPEAYCVFERGGLFRVPLDGSHVRCCP